MLEKATPENFGLVTHADSSIPLCFVSEQDDIGEVAAQIHGVKKSAAEIIGYIEKDSFKAKPGEQGVVKSPEGHPEVVFVGVNPSYPLMHEVRKYSSELPDKTYRIGYSKADQKKDILIGFAAGQYKFKLGRFSSGSDQEPARRLLVDSDDMLNEAVNIASSSHFTTDLVANPANYVTPKTLASIATNLFGKGVLQTKVVGEKLLKQGFPLIYAVGQGAADEKELAPRLIHLRIDQDESFPRVALVGKGITYDVGGVAMKAAPAMFEMYRDMGGAAHVLGLAKLMNDASLPINMDVFVPIAQNVVSANAYLNSDVLDSRVGKTVRVDNTDAEGRLILADAITLACEQKPDLLITMATLTGAAQVARGTNASSLITHNSDMGAFIAECSRDVSDFVSWQDANMFPYEMDAMRLPPGSVADMRNALPTRDAGHITAYAFLHDFFQASVTKAGIQEPPPYLHFDIPAANTSKHGPIKECDTANRAIYEALKRGLPGLAR